MNYQNPTVTRNNIYLKEYFKKKTTLGLVIVWGLSVLLSFASNISNAITNSNLSFPADNSPFAESFSQEYNISTSFTFPIIPILVFIGFLLLYIKSKKPDPAVTPKAGAGLLWGTSIAMLVISILVSLLLLLLMTLCSVLIIGVFFGADYMTADALPEDTSVLLITAFLLSGFLLCFAVIIITYLMVYISFQLKFYSSIRKSLRTPVLTAKGSVGYGVMQIITVVFHSLTGILSLLLVSINLINAITQTVQGGDTDPLRFFGIILTAFISLCSFILNLLAAIFTAKFTFGYNKHIKAAGKNGENLPMPITDQVVFPRTVATAPVSEDVFANPYAQAPTKPIGIPKPQVAEEKVSLDGNAELPKALEPVEDTAEVIAETAPSAEPQEVSEEEEVTPEETIPAPAENTPQDTIKLSDLTPEARQIVEEVLGKMKGENEN